MISIWLGFYKVNTNLGFQVEPLNILDRKTDGFT
jgi:hypothetical protein